MDNIILQQEHSTDYQRVELLIQRAFEKEEFSDKQEHHLVAKLRASESFIPELSIIAKHNYKIIGHILFTKAKIVNEQITAEILVLAPMVVDPDYQRNGIGTKLIEYGLNLASQLGFKYISVLGHPDYYARFGFKESRHYNINPPFDIPPEYIMMLELTKNSLQDISGIIQYAPEFGC